MNCIVLNTHKIIDFPEVRQSKNYTCGISALQAILYYYGLSYREDELEKLIPVSKRVGTQPNEIIRFCRHLGLQVDEQFNMTLDQVKDYLDRKIPVLTVFQAWGSPRVYNENDNGHYSVIIGVVDHDPVKEPLVIFEDPVTIGRVYLKWHDFLNRWHDQDAHGRLYQRYGIMIYGKPPIYDSHLICEIE